MLLARLPGLRQLSSMSRSDLRGDLVAGVVVTAFLVPVGMGYSQASGLPPVYGLYATVLPLLVYAVLGPSRILVLGPDSSLAPLIAATILPLASGDPDRAVALAGALSIGAGLIALAAGIGKFGFVTELLSMPVRVGYLNGIAVVVIIAQLPKMLGVSVESDMALGGLVELLRTIGDVDRVPATVGVASLVGLIVVRLVAPRWPRSLVVVVAGIVAVEVFDLGADLALVGTLPSGFPVPTIPSVGWGDLSQLAAGALTIAAVSFADTSVLSRAYAKRLDQEVDPNAEFIGLGAANVVAGFFQGFPVSASSSRTPVAESAGARTQLTGVVAAVLIVVLLVAAPGLLASLPLATLAAIVIVAVADLLDLPTLVSLARWRRNEFLLSMIAFVGVVVAGVVWGIGVAIGVSLLAFVSQAWRPHVTTLVRIEGVSGYHDIDRHPEGVQVEGLLLFRFDAPLFFANADGFRAEVMERVDGAPDVRWVIVTAEPITSIDATAEGVIHELHADLAERGIELGFAELKGVVRDQIGPGGTAALIGEHRLFPTIGEAVSAYVEETGSDFTDWKTERRHAAGGSKETTVTTSPAAEVDITEETVRSLLREQMPDLADLDLVVVGDGWDNVTYRLGPDLAGALFAVRLPRRWLGATLLVHEQRWLPVIEPLLTLHAPIPLRIGRPNDDYPWPWSLCRWIEGRPALESPPGDPLFAAMELGAFLAALHVRAPLTAPHNAHRGVPLAERSVGFEADLVKAGDLVDAERMASAWAEVLATPPWSGPPVWLHGDMHPLNLLVADGQWSGVIDFGDITSGDPASDLAVAWMLWPDDRKAREVFRNTVAHDDDTWERARGWALCLGLVIAVNAADRPAFAAMARRTIDAALSP